MDDLSFEGSQPELRHLLIDIQNEGRRIGLEINASKTRILTTEEADEALRNEGQETIKLPEVKLPIDSDYDDGAYFVTFYNYAHLDSIQAQALATPDQYDRATLGRILKSLRHYEVFDRAEEWASKAPLMPHAADKLGRYLLAAKEYCQLSLNLSDWCYETLTSRWHIPDWVAAQYAIAVPSCDLKDPLKKILRKWIKNCNSLQQVAVATDRLSRLDPLMFKVDANAALDSSPNPQYHRILALGLANVGDSHNKVRKILQLSESNELTHLFLEWSDWRTLRTEEDFDASARQES